MSNPHILISQNKNIGDVVLCFATARLIKQMMPSAKVSLLALPYTHPVAKHCPDIDELVDWQQLSALSDDEFVQVIKSKNYSCVIHLASNKRIAKLCYQAKVPTRIGTNQKIYHWLYCNKTISQARRHSRLHELQLNANMLKPLGLKQQYSKAKLIDLQRLNTPNCPLPTNIKQQLSSNQTNIILHPGSNGHGREWPESYFIELAQQLNKQGIGIVITGTDKEAARFQSLIDACPFAINTMAKLSLEQLMVLIDKCDLLLASGTGPVHIAAALNKPTIGLFPPRNGISPRRWAPPGKKVTSLMHKRFLPCFGCTESQSCACMAALSVAMVESHIKKMLKQ